MRTIIYIADIKALNDTALFDSFYSQMPQYRQRKIDNMKQLGNKLESLGAGILLKRACADFGIAGEDSFVSISKYGKPYFANVLDVHFNISHSNERVMCAISDNNIGCDIEKIRPFKDNIIDKVCSEDELLLFAGLSEAEKQRLFTRIWTVKESVMKADGRGLSANPGSFMLRMEDRRLSLADTKYIIKEFDAGDDYCCAICSESEINPELHPLIIGISELKKYL